MTTDAEFADLTERLAERITQVEALLSYLRALAGAIAPGGSMQAVVDLNLIARAHRAIAGELEP